jgi:hypothetical protein
MRILKKLSGIVIKIYLFKIKSYHQRPATQLGSEPKINFFYREGQTTSKQHITHGKKAGKLRTCIREKWG